MKSLIQNERKASAIFWLILAGALLALPLPVAAQLTRGSISGSVVDSSGAAVSNATVTITATETHVRTRAQSGSDGLFLIAAVLPGSYTLTVEARGFKTLEQTNLHLSAGQRLAVGELQLNVGNVTQTVTVQGHGKPVDLESGDQGAEVTSTVVDHFPMAGRNWASLLNILPGAATPDELPGA